MFEIHSNPPLANDDLNALLEARCTVFGRFLNEVSFKNGQRSDTVPKWLFYFGCATSGVFPSCLN